jgi:hypothetical protein
VHPPGFSLYRGYEKITSRVYSCASTRPCGTNPEVLPSWSLRPRHSDMLSRWTRSENINLSRSLLGCCNTQDCWVNLLSFSQIPPDGSEMSSLLSSVYHRWWSQVFCSSMVVDNIHSSGGWSALPMGVAPEAIVELYLFKYSLKISLSLIIIFILHKKYTLWLFYRVHDQRSRWA